MSQPGLDFAQAYAAGLLTNKGSPLYGHLGWPKYMAGGWYRPQGYFSNGGSVTTTTNRCYYVLLGVNRVYTFAGASTHNSGTGDNGEKIRLMVFNDDAVNGGPGTLAKDFGEITLTGAAAVRTLSSSWSAVPGLYWGAVWHNSDATMYEMETYSYSSGVGGIAGFMPGHVMPDLAFSGAPGFVMGLYVDTAYGAAPATAVAPTGIVGANGNPNPAGISMPVFALKA